LVLILHLQYDFQAATTKTALLGIKIDVVKEDERNTVIASALRLMENKLEVTACKLFRIDNALLFSVSEQYGNRSFTSTLQICSAVFSYLFVMLQFDRSTDKSLQATNTTRS
jgi:gustatory receptor